MTSAFQADYPGSKGGSNLITTCFVHSSFGPNSKVPADAFFKMTKKKKSILVFCAHSDDEIFGPGATLAKYSRQGKKVYTVIFSYGESALAWLKPEVAIKTRIEEAKGKIDGNIWECYSKVRDLEKVIYPEGVKRRFYKRKVYYDN